jgi:hypothetical protein
VLAHGLDLRQSSLWRAHSLSVRMRRTTMRAHHKPQPQIQDFAFWQPDLAWWTSANSRLHDSFVAMTDAWQDFVNRRLQEDLRLWQALVGAKTPEATWSAYTDFCENAVRDYCQEYATLSKHSSEFATAGIAAAQQASERALAHAKAH